MNWKQLKSLARAGAMLVAFAAAAPFRAEAQDLTKVTIALPVLASVTMSLHYARDAGIFRKHGLEVDLPVFRGVRRRMLHFYLAMRNFWLPILTSISKSRTADVRSVS